MIWYELKRFFNLRILFISAVFMIPLLLLTSLVFMHPKKAQPIKTDEATIKQLDDNLAALPQIITRLSSTDENNTAYKLLNNNWDGETYYSFYMNNSTSLSPEEAFNVIMPKFNAAKSSFKDFFELYDTFMRPMPIVFVYVGEYESLDWGIEELQKYFYPESPYSNYAEINAAQLKMNYVFEKVNFHDILSSSRDMKLTPEQAAELRKYLEQLSVKLGALSGEQYADYSKMVYDYVTIRMRNYIAENANTPTSKYQGFTIPEREMQRKQLIRLDWLFENNKFDKDFSYESYGLSSKNAFSIMHKITGTTIIDYVYNSIELICPFLSLLVVFFVVHCIYDDMKNKTILGAVASKHNRWEIILSKLLACTILLVIMLAVFGTLFYIIGGALTGSAAVPPPVLVISGKVAVTNASTIIIVEFLMLLLKLFLIMSFTALLCIFIATLTKRIYSPTTSRVIMYVPACLFAIGEVLLWVFLKQFIEFNAIFLTCAITASCAFVFQTCRIFIKKEYL